ncbi:MAG: arsenate reductase [Burkholderiales bacterium]|nr:arsenate reductase [Burkholderiales bacterium]
MIELYGIPNCNSVKKTRAWLEARGIAYQFHDFKKSGIDAVTLKKWLKTMPLDVLINKKGTTWRGLSGAEKVMADAPETAIELMMSKTSVIKRPVVVYGVQIFVGHDETRLQSIIL